MEPTVNKYLIFDHLVGKSTPMQRLLIEGWLQDDLNRETYYQWLVEWENQSPQYLPELESKVKAYIEYLENQPTQERNSAETQSFPPNKYPKKNWFLWLTAATILLISGILGLVNRDRLFYTKYVTGFNETKSLHLSDGSKVTMNANSSLLVPRFGFGSKTREVRLTGEANFSVKHTADHQKFIVRAENDLEIIVLGTEFTVYARQRGSKVVLNEGKVQLRYGKEEARKQVTMVPGELVTLDQEGRAKISKTPHPRNYAAWMAHRFVFEGTSLEELRHLFNENFGLKIIITDEDLGQLMLYGSFRAESAQQLLQELSASANLHYRQQKDTIYITQSSHPEIE